MDKFFLGLGLGIVGGMLFAPRRGDETRQMIADRAGEGADYLKGVAADGFDQVKSAAADSVDYVKSKTGGLGSKADDLIQKGTKALKRESAAVRDTVEDYQRV
jgi:gas vesicle protein